MSGSSVGDKLRQCLDKRWHSPSRWTTCSALLGVAVYICLLHWFSRLSTWRAVPLPDRRHGASRAGPAESPDALAHTPPPHCSLLPWPQPLHVAPRHLSSAARAVVRVVRVARVARGAMGVLDERPVLTVGDRLTLRVDMLDGSGKAKRYGCDFLVARVYNAALGNAAAGQVTDHDNGTYSVEFTFPWAGESRLEVTLVHHGEAVAVLERAREFVPEKVSFWGNFVSGEVKKATPCHFVLNTVNEVCSYGDERLNESWVCEKPDGMACDSMLFHSSYTKRERIFADQKKELFPGEQLLPMNRIYHVQEASESSAASLRCGPGLGNPRPSGHYVHHEWRSSSCRVRRFRTAADIAQCLRHKSVHLLGDSTIGQWWEYLRKFTADSGLPPPPGVQPRGKQHLGSALNRSTNTSLHYHCHGYPVLTQHGFTKGVVYVSRRVDAIGGGAGVVVVISLGAHFAAFPLGTFHRRLVNIRAAVERLFARSPDTRVVVKLANARDTGHNIELFNNWNTFRFNDVTLEVFRGLHVAFVDAWEMTAAVNMRLIHPSEWVVKNQIDLFLSYIC